MSADKNVTIRISLDEMAERVKASPEFAELAVLIKDREQRIGEIHAEKVASESRAASLSRELLDAMQARDSYRASADLRVGMRREFEALLGVSDTTAPETFEAGLVRLRALLAAERRAEEAWAKAVHEMEARASDAVAHGSIAALCAGTGLPLSKHMTTVEAVSCVVDALASERAARVAAEKERDEAERGLDAVVAQRDQHEADEKKASGLIETLQRALGKEGVARFAAESRAARLLTAMKEIRDELGVPQPGYPAPVANAARTARAALAAEEGK